jgi:hypothetical protein
MKTFKTLSPALFLAMVLLVSGCTAYGPRTAHNYDISHTAMVYQVSLTGDSELMNQPRKVLYSARLTLTAKNPDSAAAAISRIAQNHQGYLSRSGTQTVVIRVKSTQLAEALTEIAALGKVTDRALTGQDVTDEYMDHQIRLENALKARSRYLELLDQATNVDEALKVERELERLNETIDLLKGKARKHGSS